MSRSSRRGRWIGVTVLLLAIAGAWIGFALVPRAPELARVTVTFTDPGEYIRDGDVSADTESYGHTTHDPAHLSVAGVFFECSDPEGFLAVRLQGSLGCSRESRSESELRCDVRRPFELRIEGLREVELFVAGKSHPVEVSAEGVAITTVPVGWQVVSWTGVWP